LGVRRIAAFTPAGPVAGQLVTTRLPLSRELARESVSYHQEGTEVLGPRIRKQGTVDNHILYERDARAQAVPAGLEGRSFALNVSAAPEEPEETLVADSRGNPTPSQTVARRLAQVLQTSHPCPLRWNEGV
jgi:hypothetical protein